MSDHWGYSRHERDIPRTSENDPKPDIGFDQRLGRPKYFRLTVTPASCQSSNVQGGTDVAA